MWWLSAYPKVRVTPQVAEPSHSGRRSWHRGGCRGPHGRSRRLAVRAEQAGSFAGRMGHAVAPVFEPLGFDWQLTVGVLTSFLAREVFVSTMSVLAGGQADAEVDEGVVARIRGMTRDDGAAGVHTGDRRRRTRLLRAGDAVPAHADGHPEGDGRPSNTPRCSLVTCRAWPTSWPSSCIRACGRRECRRSGMSAEMLQHALVTLVALAATAAVVRRVFGSWHARTANRLCSCPSGSGACATPGTARRLGNVHRAPRGGSYPATHAARRQRPLP